MMDMRNMGGMGWMMMGGMGLIWLLVAVGLILGVLALLKYLRSTPVDRRAFEPPSFTNPLIQSETASTPIRGGPGFAGRVRSRSKVRCSKAVSF